MNIYIANLNYDVDDNDLKELFEGFGTVSSAKVITDRETGKSRGFGFVEMPVEGEANKAIEELNEAEYEGKTITVNVAKPKTDKPRRKFGSNNRGGGGGGGFNRDRRR